MCSHHVNLFMPNFSVQWETHSSVALPELRITITKQPNQALNRMTTKTIESTTWEKGNTVDMPNTPKHFLLF